MTVEINFIYKNRQLYEHRLFEFILSNKDNKYITNNVVYQAVILK